MSRPTVSLVRYEDPLASLRRAVELCDGLAGLRPEDRILIKPNLVFWDFDLPFPPFGVATTTVLVSALVRILAEAGCPPDLHRFVRAMREAGVPCDYADYVAYRQYLYDRYRDQKEFDLSLYYLN